MANVYKTRIDIKNTRPSFKPTFVQYDHARIEIELLDNAQYYDLSNVQRVEFTHVRPDGEPITEHGEIVSNDGKQFIRYQYKGSEMDVLGTVKTSLAVFDENDNKVSSHTFDVVIAKDLRSEFSNPSQPRFDLIETMRIDIEELKRNGGGGIGLQGPKGDPFTFEDFTQSQIELLRGPQGPQGPPGSTVLGDKSVREHNISFVEDAINLVNVDYIVANKSIDIYSGAELNGNGYYATEFIKVVGGNSYCVLPVNENYVSIYQYREDKTFIGASYNGAGLITLNSECAYVRIVAYNEYHRDGLFLAKSDTVLNYSDGYSKVKINYLPIPEIADRLGTDYGISSKRTKNLLDESKVILNSYLFFDGNRFPNEYGWKVSDFIEVEPDTLYTLSRDFKKFFSEIETGSAQFCFYYDANKVKITNILTNPFTTPSNCKYVRFSIQGTASFVQLEKGNRVGYYIPYGNESDYRELLKSKWLDKKYVCIGDSITEGSQYPILLARALGMVLTYNNGVGGTTVSTSKTNAMSSNARISLVPTDTEVITILGGSNDWAENVTLGTLDDVAMGSVSETGNYQTFAGAYKLMLNKLHARVPNARIIILEQPFRANMTATSEGKVLNDYREMTRKIAYQYGYPVIETYQKSGINQLNFATFLADVVHLNSTGVQRLANVCVAGFKNIS